MDEGVELIKFFFEFLEFGDFVAVGTKPSGDI
jgi:hypothetical protein